MTTREADGRGATDSGAPTDPAGAAGRLVAAYAARGLTLASAESLTGGLLGATITGVPGASAIYRGGHVVYATDSKAVVGGVDPAGLAEHGAVSAWTVEALARAVRRHFGADIGVALSGVAGPDRQEGHPAGTVWVAYAWGDRVETALLRLSGDRSAVRAEAVAAALERLADLAQE